MSERARKFFNTKTNGGKLNPKSIMLFGYFIGLAWSKELWCDITDKEKELTHYVRIGKTNTLEGHVSYSFIFLWLLIVILPKPKPPTK